MGTRDPNPDVDELLRYNVRPRPLPPPTSLPRMRPVTDVGSPSSCTPAALMVFLIVALLGLFLALGWWSR